ncbi:MAG: DUF2752 domain-containing protein [Thermoanaerobaculia bacterium]
MKGARAGRLAVWAGAGAASLVAVVVLHALVLPAGRENSWCIYRRTTGMPCPGCGMTRAVVDLAHGDLAAAVRAHPVAPLLAVEALVGWILWGAWAFGRLGPAPARRVETVALWHFALLVAVWLGRAATGTLPW